RGHLSALNRARLAEARLEALMLPASGAAGALQGAAECLRKSGAIKTAGLVDAAGADLVKALATAYPESPSLHPNDGAECADRR
ncbi:MAG: hypothetical protein Q8Q73_19155, partial [Stagnimonas sp.]|nr:hypothetical protein [Stagnimonas sp.]